MVNNNNKYEIRLFNRNTPESDLLEDMRRVAKILKKNSLSTSEYNKIGNYHSSTIQNRFHSWNNALIKAELEIRKHNTIEKEELINDLKRVSKILKKGSLTQEEYLSSGKFSIQPFIRIFGNWFCALESANLMKTRNYKVSNEQYFQNIEKVWSILGHQPRYSDMQKPLSDYSNGAYERRFGNWSNALKEFVKFINANVNTNDSFEDTSNNNDTDKNIIDNKHRTPRNINWRLRFRILERDNFVCVKCGRRPPEIKLHVDHIIPYSKGGETIPENLETLCEICNIGKSNLLP